MVSTPLKNISQLGWVFPIYGKIKNVSKPPTSLSWGRPTCFVSKASGWSKSQEVSKLGRPAAVALSRGDLGRRPWDFSHKFKHNPHNYGEISPTTTGTAGDFLLSFIPVTPQCAQRVANKQGLWQAVLNTFIYLLYWFSTIINYSWLFQLLPILSAKWLKDGCCCTTLVISQPSGVSFDAVSKTCS